MKRLGRMSRRTIVAAGVAALALCSTAGAAEVSVSGETISFRADPGEVNATKVELAVQTSGQVPIPCPLPCWMTAPRLTFALFTDLGAGIRAGAGCVAAGVHAAACALPLNWNRSRIDIDLGDEADTYIARDGAGWSDLTLVIHAGPGDDEISVAGNESVSGDSGNDKLTHTGDSTLYLGPSFLSGGAGADVINTYAASAEGGDGDDRITASGSYRPRIDGGAGADRLQGGSQTGGPGADRLEGGAVNYADLAVPVTVTLDGVANDGPAGEGDNVLSPTWVVGSQAADTLTGSAGIDEFYGWEGDDKINGPAGNDYLDGYSGADLLDGGAGGDRLVGGDQNDTLIGGADVDEFYGQDGDDTLRALDGLAEQLDCGFGNDSYETDPADTLLTCETRLGATPTKPPGNGGGKKG